MEIVAASHVNVEKKIFDPYIGMCCSVKGLDVDGFKPFRKLVLHYLIGKTHRVCGTSIPCNIAAEFG